MFEGWRSFAWLGRRRRLAKDVEATIESAVAWMTIEELQKALQEFKNDYNEHWLIQRRGHQSPNQFRRDDMDKIQAAA